MKSPALPAWRKVFENYSHARRLAITDRIETDRPGALDLRPGQRLPGDELAGLFVDKFGVPFDLFSRRTGDDPMRARFLRGHGNNMGHDFWKIGQLVPKMVELHRRSANIHALVDFHTHILGDATTIAIACGIYTESAVAFASASHTTMDQIGAQQSQNSAEHPPAFATACQGGQARNDRTDPLRRSDIRHRLRLRLSCDSNVSKRGIGMGHLIKLVRLFYFVIHRCTSLARGDDVLVAFRSQPRSWSSKNARLRKNPGGSEHGFEAVPRFSPLEPIEDLTNKFHVVGRTTCCLRKSFRQSRIFELPLLLGESFVDGDSLV